jgi:hypothetical protein
VTGQPFCLLCGGSEVSSFKEVFRVKRPDIFFPWERATSIVFFLTHEMLE